MVIAFVQQRGVVWRPYTQGAFMRTILTFTVPVEAGNAAIKSGSLQRVTESLMATLKPEAAYFYAKDGKRCGILVFDLKETSDIPSVAEPLFMELNAAIEMCPCMDPADLKKALAKVAV
jgi:hypothetical protein